MIKPEDLKKITLFAPVPESELKSIAARAADVRLGAEEWLLMEGQAAAFFGLIEGRIDVFKNVGGRDLRIASYEPGDYFGEVPLMLGAPAIASLQAIGPARLMRLEPDDFHDLVTQCRILGGEISKTMMSRIGRIKHLTVETPRSLTTVIGHRSDAACYDLRDFLSRNRIPFTWDGDGEGSTSAGSPAPTALVLADGRRLEAPTLRAAADALGLQTVPKHDTYDVVIVGGGPTGLAAAVYGASEGLRTLLIERLAYGGQAGTSSRIENYLGFPAGLTGGELTERACRQALRFGAELLVARKVMNLEPGDPTSEKNGMHTIVLDDDTRVQCRAVILATGVDWRHLETPGLERLVGHGVYYGAGRTEAMRFNGKTVHLVGGGNSAGQAAMYFSDYAESVTMLVRGSSLADSMSDYLVQQLRSKQNVTIETDVEVVGVEGEDKLETIEVSCRRNGTRERRQSDGLFVFIGARAETDWLPLSLIRDQWDYVCTGRDVLDLLAERADGTWPLERDPYLLETSIPGVLAAGDVRHGSIKRCAAGVGEGSMAVAVVHQYFTELQTAQAAATVGRRG
jgi:thioredoxin reductase (NADPH)